MIWFFDNDHLLTVEDIRDDKDQTISDAVVTVLISDKEDNEIINQTMNADGGGKYSLALADNLISENHEYYVIEITAEKDSAKGKWEDSIKSQTRRLSEY